MEPVRWGVLSTAKIGIEKVIPAMQRGTASRVVAIASANEIRARDSAARLGIERVHNSYEELLADPSIEAVYNPLPNHLHVPWSIRALEAGKHVLCEKPIALTTAEALQLVEAEARTGKRVAEAFMVRYHPQWLRAKALASDGTIGGLRLIRVVFAYRNVDPDNIRNKAEMGGGGLYDIGCYAIAGARFLFGAEPTRAIATIDHDPVFKVDRLASGLIDFPGGRQLVFSSATQIAPRQNVEILGSKGRIVIPVPFNTDPARSTEIIIDDARDLYGGGARTEQFAPCDHYTLQGDAVSAAIRSGAPFDYPIADAVANMRTIDALMRSGESGRWETP
ncbi:MAG TPA: Gfo/Idh/MocA family oxidoreductase [Rhizomicrobium sp.]